MRERARVERLLHLLHKQPILSFPMPRGRLNAPPTQGVYVIRNSKGVVAHVGRTVRGSRGLRQRLQNHLSAQSSFVQAFLGGHGKKLREGFTFQCLPVANPRERALLESMAVAWHCPLHLGVGEGKAVAE